MIYQICDVMMGAFLNISFEPQLLIAAAIAIDRHMQG